MLTQLVEVTYGPGTLPLFDGFTLTIEDGLRLGVVGENGSGKTTLIRLIAGDISPERGEVVRRTGVRIAGLAQDDRALLAEDPPVAEYLYHSDAERELERLGAAMGTEASLGGARLAELSRAYDRALDAMASDESPDPALARDVLNDLGLRRIPEQRRMSELSGGQRRLIELARTLALQPDLLLLDEPEAHLDMRARGWLGTYLRGLRSSVVMVSHDRYMLETAATAVLDITAGRNDRYGGGYSFFLEERPKLWARREKEFQLQTERVDRIQQQFYMFREWARLNSDFASRARARLKMLERAKAQVQQPAPRSARTMTLAFRSEARGRIMVEGSGAAYAYPDGPMIGPLDVVLERGDRVALVGPNGAGKSTLLAMLSGRLAPTAGKLRLKEGMRIATLAQESLVEGLEATPLEVIVEAKPMAQDEAVRRICALGLSYQHCVSPMSRLSGGQRVRVHLLRVSLEQPDLLLLDEPTNYIDTDSAEVVQTALEEFTGCVVAATHDRWLVETYATRVLVMEPDARGARLRETEPAALENAPYG